MAKWTKISETSRRILWHSDDGNGIEIFHGVGERNNYWYVVGDGLRVSKRFNTKTKAKSFLRSWIKKN